MNRQLYFDYAATTPVDPEVVAAVADCMANVYGNPSSIHGFGQAARQTVAQGRQRLAELIGASPSEIFFTSGGSESDNLALRGAALANSAKGRHIITTAVEHHAVLHACAALEEDGFSVTYLPVDELGRICLEDLKAAIRDDTILISVMFANNEVGTIEPVAAIGEMARRHGILFHTDAVQAVGHVPIDVRALQIDLLSLSGHKFYGPKGIGALFVRSGVKMMPQIRGGGQERSLRAGTENVPGIAGIGLAACKAGAELAAETKRLEGLRERLIAELEARIPGCRLNGDRSERLPGNVNFSFDGIAGESLLMNLDLQGIAASSGSACSAGSIEPSHVLLAMGRSPAEAASALRLTFGRGREAADVERLLDILPATIARLRGC